MSNESLLLNGSMITFIQGNLTNFDIKTLVPWRYTAESTQLKESTIFYDDSKLPKYGKFDQSYPIRYVNNKITYVDQYGNKNVMYGNVIMCRALILTDGQLTSIPVKVRVVFNQVDLTNPNTRYITFACAHQNYTGRYFVGASFYYADISFSKFTRCRLDNADFRDTIMYGCDFTGANLAGANISGCDIGSIIIDKDTNIDRIMTRRYIRATKQNIWIKQSKAMVYKLADNTLDITLKTKYQNITIGNANSHGIWKPSSTAAIPHPIYFSKRNHMNVCNICFLCPGGTNLEGLNLQGCDISNMDLKDAILVGCDISSVIINENTDLYNVVLVDERVNARKYKHSVIQNAPIIYRSSYSSRINITIRLGSQNIIIDKKKNLINNGPIVFKELPMCAVNKDGTKVTKMFSVYCSNATNKNEFYLLFLVPGANLSGINLKGCDLSGLDLTGTNLGDAIIDMNTDIKDIVVWNTYTNFSIVQDQPIIYRLLEKQNTLSIKWGGTSFLLYNNTNITHIFTRLSDDIYIYIYASFLKTELRILFVCPGVNLSGFNLRGFDLRNVNLTEAVLVGTDISSIVINENTDLNNVVLLDENVHSHTYKQAVIQKMPILYKQSNTSNTYLTIKLGVQNVVLTEKQHLLQNDIFVFKGLPLRAIDDYGTMVTKTYSVYISNNSNNDFLLFFLVPGINFSDMNLQRCDLSDLDLAGANFSGAVIDKETNFRNMIVGDEKREWFIKQERPFIYRSDSGPEASEEITLKYSVSSSEQDAVRIGSKSSMRGASESFDLRMRDSQGLLAWIKTRIYFSKISSDGNARTDGNDRNDFYLYILLPFVNLINVDMTDVDLRNLNLSSANLVGAELGGAQLNEHTNIGDVVLCDDKTGRSILQSGPLKYVLEDNTAKTLTIKLKSNIFTIGTVLQQTGVSTAFQTRAITTSGELVNRNTFVYFKKSDKNVTNFDYEIYFLLPGVRFGSNTFLNLENCNLSGINLIGIDVSGASVDKNTNICDVVIWNERTSTSIVQNKPMTYKLLESQTDLSIMCGEKPFYFGITVASFKEKRKQMSEPFHLKALSNDGTYTNIIVRIYVYMEPNIIYQTNLQSLSMYIICPGLNHQTRDFSAFNWKDMHLGASDLTNAVLAGAKIGGAFLNEHTDMKDIIYVVEEKNKQTIYVIQDEPLIYKPADLESKDLTIKCGDSRFIVGNKSNLPTVTKNLLPAKTLVKNIQNQVQNQKQNQQIRDITLTTYISSKNNNAGHYFMCFLFPGINLIDMNLQNCDLRDLDLSNTNFVGANLSGVIINEYTNIRNIQLWNEKDEKYAKQDTPIIYTWNHLNRRNGPFKVKVGNNSYVMPAQSNNTSPGIYTISILSMDTQNTMQTRTCPIYYRYTNRLGIGHLFFLIPGVFLAETDLRGCNLSGFNMLDADLSGATIDTTTIFNNVVFYDERSRISVKIRRPISYVLVNNQNQISLSTDVNNIIVLDTPSTEYSPNISKNFMGKVINKSGNIVDAQVPVYYKKREKKKTDIYTFFDFIFIVRGVNLAGVDLSGCDLSGADLSGSDMGGAILNRSTNIGSVVLWNEVDGKFNYVIQASPMIYVVHFGEQETDISLLNGSGERIVIGRKTDLRSVSQKFSVRVLNANEQLEERTVAIYAEKVPSHSDDHLHFQLYFLCPGVDLSGKDLSGLDLSNLDMSECNLRGANLVGTHLNGTIFNKNTFIGKNLLYDERVKEYLPGDRFRMHMILPQDLILKTEGGKYINELNGICSMQFIDNKGDTRDFVARVIFKRDKKKKTGQSHATVRFVVPFSNFRGDDLSDVDLSNTDLRGCDFRGANLQNINLNDSDLDGIWIDQNTDMFNAVATNIRGKAYYCQDDGNVVLLTTGHMKTMHNIYAMQKDNRIFFFLAVKKFTNTIIKIVYESKSNLFLFSSTGNKTIVKDEYIDLNNLTCPNFGLLSTVPFPYECRSLETSKVRFLVSENEPYIANKVPLDTYELNSYIATGFLYLYESVNTNNMTQTYFDILVAYGTKEDEKRGRYILHRQIPVMDGNRYVEKIVYATKNITGMLDSKTDIQVFEYLESNEKFFVKIQDTIYEPSVRLTTNFIYPPSNYSIVLKIKTNNYFY
jgi:uncharacterized protein YjbI with pentapeptide repeats